MSKERLPLPDASVLRVKLSYDPDSGSLTWRSSGRAAGHVYTTGYARMRFGGRLYAVHRLVWKIVTGADPVRDIDHADGCRSNNAWANLREADHAANMRNRGAWGAWPKGVARDRKNNRFRADIGSGATHRFLGWFKTPEAAAEAYRVAAEKQYADFACTDRRAA